MQKYIILCQRKPRNGKGKKDFRISGNKIYSENKKTKESKIELLTTISNTLKNLFNIPVEIVKDSDMTSTQKARIKSEVQLNKNGDLLFEESQVLNNSFELNFFVSKSDTLTINFYTENLSSFSYLENHKEDRKWHQNIYWL